MGVDTFGDPAKKAEEVADFKWFSQSNHLSLGLGQAAPSYSIRRPYMRTIPLPGGL